MVLSILEEPFNLEVSFDSISTIQREEIHGIFARMRAATHAWKLQRV
ncbi:hypothetical protein ES288_A05G310300v1 [Gossypium darwinii]|uniref:Uncharacterized protein n=1 Tax=Gossypium darwinii TaxID=34276 RepID=A0A5D2GL91_GOSDA|nr:hypothetical protein ES288_A05G310300v1 [Gossypium darwinii]